MMQVFHVPAKAEFIEEGFARGYLRINGQWADHVLFGMRREDFLVRPFMGDELITR